MDEIADPFAPKEGQVKVFANNNHWHSTPARKDYSPQKETRLQV
jgi:hypothetical protein